MFWDGARWVRHREVELVFQDRPERDRTRTALCIGLSTADIGRTRTRRIGLYSSIVAALGSDQPLFDPTHLFSGP